MGEDRVYSVNEVVAALDRLDGQTIRIAGALVLEFEGDCLVHIPLAEQHPGYGSQLWVDFDLDVFGDDRRPLHQFASRHAIVTATVDRENTGHMGLWPGGVVIHAVAKHKRR